MSFFPTATALAMAEWVQAGCKVSGAYASHAGDHTAEDSMHFTCLTFPSLWNLVRHVEKESPQVAPQIQQCFEVQDTLGAVVCSGSRLANVQTAVAPGTPTHT